MNTLIKVIGMVGVGLATGCATPDLPDHQYKTSETHYRIYTNGLMRINTSSERVISIKQYIMENSEVMEVPFKRKEM